MAKRPPSRRQDLYVWLKPEEEEELAMKAWGLIPRNPQWLKKYEAKKAEHAKRQLKSDGRECFAKCKLNKANINSSK